MKTTQLDNTGTAISVIGFGGMHLSIAGRPDEAEARRVLHASLDSGVTFIDTADVYCLDENDIGHNERLIASVLRERKDASAPRVGTKGGLGRPRGDWTRDASPAHLREACEKSLRALDVDRIFLYQLHAPDPHVPFEKSVETLAELQRAGKIEHIGVSNVDVDEIRRAAGIVSVVSVQNRLNPYFREAIEEGVIEECAARGITLLAYSPLGGGRLSKKIPQFPVLKKIAAAHEGTPWQVTIAWVRAQGPTVVPIPAATRIESAVSSARAADLTLTPDEIAEIDETEFSRV